jgi:hypothetical protein
LVKSNQFITISQSKRRAKAASPFTPRPQVFNKKEAHLLYLPTSYVSRLQEESNIYAIKNKAAHRLVSGRNATRYAV